MHKFSNTHFGFLLVILGAIFGFPNTWMCIPGTIILFPLGLILIAENSQSAKKAFKHGWLASTAASAIPLYWLVIPLCEHGGFHPLLAWPAPILLGTYLGLFGALFTLACRLFCSTLSWPLAGLAAGSTWAALQLLSAHLLTGFPWLTLATGFAFAPDTLKSLRFIGSEGFALVLTASAFWLTRISSLKPALLAVSILAALFVLPAIFDPYAAQKVQDAPRMTACVIQGSIDQDQKWDEAYQQFTIDKYLAMSSKAIAKYDHPVLLWPETAMPFYMQDSTDLVLQIQGFARKNSVSILTGSPGYEFTNVDPPIYNLFNRLYHINSFGQLNDHYDKKHLVPFGEYTPLGTFLPFMGKLTAGAIDFSSGNSTAPIRISDLALGVLICYETIFPQLAQQSVDQGANVLVNSSNDAWFGKSSAPFQHLAQSVLRAIEQNRQVIRATNTGISAFIDNNGQITKSTPLFEDSILGGNFDPLAQKTFYHNYRTLILTGTVTLCLLLLICSLVQNRRKRTDDTL